MLGLALRVGFANGRAGQPIARLQLMTEALALTNAQLNLVTTFQTLGQLSAAE